MAVVLIILAKKDKFESDKSNMAKKIYVRFLDEFISLKFQKISLSV